MRNYRIGWALGSVVLLMATQGAGAQTPPAAGGGTTQYSAPRQELRPNGVTMYGTVAQPARIISPQLDVAARTIAFDYSGNQFTKIVGTTSVHIKVNLASQGNQDARVDATCNQAILIPGTRTLTLIGAKGVPVNGYYQVGNGPKNTLQGDRAVLTYVNNVINATITGSKGVTVVVPAGGLAQVGTMQMGDVTITATRATIEEGATAHFIGNAHAVSTGAPNKFDVRATEFTITRNPDGSFNTLTTIGRTHIILDLPPEPAASTPPPINVTVNGGAATPPVAPPAPATTAPATTTPAATTPAAGANGAGAPTKGAGGILGNVGSPTHVDAYADSATLTGTDLVLTLNDNVTGFYQLTPPGGGTPGTYNFSGAKAVLQYVPLEKASTNKLAGFNAIVTGTPDKPAIINGPPLNLSMGSS